METRLMPFEILGKDSSTRARRGRMTTGHGVVETPVFMPVGTAGTVKGIAPWELESLDAGIILGNTYHLYLRPGLEVLGKMGGLHRMMSWDRAILTDSGGYQVFSLKGLRKITEEGVRFKSHLDGSAHFLSPERAIEIQETIGSDIMMVLDECPPPDSKEQYMIASMERTTRWAARCLEARTTDAALFGILQGGTNRELRERHAAELTRLPFDGFAIGGLSVGEPVPEMYACLEYAADLLPADRPRYLMGVGRPADILTGVLGGVDMFDCVLPTRSGRTGLLFTRQGEIVIKQARYRFDETPVDPQCSCPTCRRFSRAYLRHLFVSGEMLGSILNTLHNLHFYLEMMREVRAAIEEDRFGAMASEWLPRIERRLPEGM